MAQLNETHTGRSTEKESFVRMAWIPVDLSSQLTSRLLPAWMALTDSSRRIPKPLRGISFGTLGRKASRGPPLPLCGRMRISWSPLAALLLPMAAAVCVVFSGRSSNAIEMRREKATRWTRGGMQRTVILSGMGRNSLFEATCTHSGERATR